MRRMALSYLHIDRDNDNILHKPQAFAPISEYSNPLGVILEAPSL